MSVAELAGSDWSGPVLCRVGIGERQSIEVLRTRDRKKRTKGTQRTRRAQTLRRHTLYMFKISVLYLGYLSRTSPPSGDVGSWSEMISSRRRIQFFSGSPRARHAARLVWPAEPQSSHVTGNQGWIHGFMDSVSGISVDPWSEAGAEFG